LILGIVPETGLLGGLKSLRKDLAAEAIRIRIAEPLGLTVEQAAAAIHAVQNAQTGDLLRKIVVESGYDPREFVVYAFGGAGPAHCAAYAAEVGVTEVVVPLGPVASAFSAFGLAVSDVVLVQEHSDPMPAPFDPVRVESNFLQLERRVREALAEQGLSLDRVELYRELDMRYGLQMGEVTTPIANGKLDTALLEVSVQEFEKRYAQLYGAGSGFREAGIFGITYRVRGVGVLEVSPRFDDLAPANSEDAGVAISSRRPVCLDGTKGFVDTPIYDHSRLRDGHVIHGPAVVEVPTTSVVIRDGMNGWIDRFGNLHIETRSNVISLAAQRRAAL
jgi:N-methylhydantoinase A